MIRICAVTVGRSDWGILRPVLDAVRSDPQFRLHLVASGAHLAAGHGDSLKSIIDDGFTVNDEVEMLLASDSPAAIARSMGVGTAAFADVFRRASPDFLLLLGDRFEMHSAAVAAVPFRIPIAHLHGGEVTEGAIDDVFRHAITKYSHLHFVSTEEHQRRVVQLGEEPWRVTVCGAPALDNLKTLKLLSRESLSELTGISMEVPPVLCTIHPVTLQYDQTEDQLDEILKALAEIGAPIIMTRPNADTCNHQIVRRMEQFAERHSNVRLLRNLGTQCYFSLMQIASAMVGNSSSGIIEAASFGLPVVNIGIRQSGRPRSGNVIDVDCSADQIRNAMQKAMSREFRDHVAQNVTNVYGDGRAAERIVTVLRNHACDERLLLKKFFDLADYRALNQVPGARHEFEDRAVA
jgi:UDP-hydrolysing UDP-N-acetyl-D-glucosamine 2-epimerase